jgi:uncharacterized membrane protein
MKIKINRHLLFKIGIYFKAVFALVEITSGILLIFSNQEIISRIVYFMFQNELIEDPNDFFANFIFNLTDQFTLDAKLFLSLYVLSHGAIKIIALVGLFRNKLWAYPVSIIIFTLFIIYQLARFTSTHSLWLVFLTFIDLIFIWLVWLEYKTAKMRAGFAQ